MAVGIMELVWQRTDFSQSETLVMLALADRSDPEGHCWPSVAGVAERARMSERSVQRVMRAMEEKGFLNVDKGGGRKTNAYTINVEHLRGDTVSPVTPSVTAPPTQLCHPSGDIAVSPDPSLTVIEPSGLNLPAWRTWVKYRKERKLKPYTTSGAARQMEWLSCFSQDQQRRVVEHSMRQGYQGLFEPKESGNGTSGGGGKSRPSAVERVRLATEAWLSDRDEKGGGGVVVDG